MKQKSSFFFLLAAVAAIAQPSRTLAIQYLSVDFSQDVAAFARDYVGDPGSSLDQKEWVRKPADFFAPWPADRSLLAASVSRTRENGLTAAASSISLAAYQIDPFSLASGFTSIAQHVDSQTYYVVDPPDVNIGEAYARVGANGDAIGFRFRVDESEGDVVLRIRAAWANTGGYSDQSLFMGGQGNVYLNGFPIYADSPGIHLSAGEHRLEITKFGFDGGPFLNSGNTNGQFVASWTFDNTFTGETPSRPYATVPCRPDTGCTLVEDDPPPATDPDNIAGVKLTFPVAEGFGTSQDVFVGFQPRIPQGVSAGALATGYEIISEYSSITSFVMPELLPGAEELTIEYDGLIQDVAAGERIDFGPEGVESFTLAGFDPTGGVAGTDALVMGLRFVDEGLASLTAIPTLYIPPGDFDENGFVNGRDFLLWQRDPSTGDLADWQANYGTPALVATTAALAVPEPTGVLFGVALVLSAFAARRGLVTAKASSPALWMFEIPSCRDMTARR